MASSVPRRIGCVVIGVLIVGVVGICAAALPVLALRHRSDLPLEPDLGRIAVKFAAADAKNATNPVSNDRRAINTGREAWIGSCAVCHGTNGDGKSLFGQALYPPTPDLRADASKSFTDGELFWIIKNGLSFVGMPAFGEHYDDPTIWSMVAYIRSLQNPTTTQQGFAIPAIPTPTVEQISFADPAGTTQQQGAAIYFAMGCHLCHGAIGNAPGDLSIRRGGGEAQEAIRRGREGMPKYPTDQISDANLQTLLTYLDTFPATNGGEERRPPFGGGQRPSTDGQQRPSFGGGGEQRSPGQRG